jgi:hypothetical protein
MDHSFAWFIVVTSGALGYIYRNLAEGRGRKPKAINTKAVYITVKAGRQQKMLGKTFVLCLIDITP